MAGAGGTDERWWCPGVAQDELAIFKTQQGDKPGKELRPSSDGSDIVVRYSGGGNSEHKPQPQQPGSQSITTDYATVNEIAMDEQRKEKKCSRLSSVKALCWALGETWRRVHHAEREVQ